MIRVQRAALCPHCGDVPVEMHDDWNVLEYDECLTCHWNNRPSFEEWAASLRRAFDAGEFDGDPVVKDYVKMELYDLEHPEE